MECLTGTETVNVTRESTHIIFTRNCAFCVLKNMTVCALLLLTRSPSPQKSITSLTNWSQQSDVRCYLLPMCPSTWMVELLIWTSTKRVKKKKRKKKKLCMFVAIYSTVVQKLMEFILPGSWFLETTFPKSQRSIPENEGKRFPKRERLS